MNAGDSPLSRQFGCQTKTVLYEQQSKKEGGDRITLAAMSSVFFLVETYNTVD